MPRGSRDESLRPMRKPVSLVNGGDRQIRMPDSAPMNAAQQQASAAGEPGADADQPRADAVDRGGAQRLAGRFERPKKSHSAAITSTLRSITSRLCELILQHSRA